MENEIVYILTGVSQRFTGETEKCIVGAYKTREKAERLGKFWVDGMKESDDQYNRNWEHRYEIKEVKVF